jgi:CTP synthase (UTP-ammonia lyase)
VEILHRLEALMVKSLKIGIVGDFDEGRTSQLKTIEALEHASNELSIPIDIAWLPTASLSENSAKDIKQFDGIWAGPGDYTNPSGALQAIKYCREQQWPFIGT